MLSVENESAALLKPPFWLDVSDHVRVEVRDGATGLLVRLDLVSGTVLLVRQRNAQAPAPLLSAASSCVAAGEGWYELSVVGLTPAPLRLRIHGPLWMNCVHDAVGPVITVLEGEGGAGESTPAITELAPVRASPSGFALANEDLLQRFAAEAPRRDLLALFTSSLAGDEAMRMGAILPALGIPAWTYLVTVLAAGHSLESLSLQIGGVTHLEGYYPLTPPVVIAAGEALEQWLPDPRRRVLKSIDAPCWVRASLHSVEVWGGARLPLLVLGHAEGRTEVSAPLINPPLDLDT